jgi:hypothetical protein
MRLVNIGLVCAVGVGFALAAACSHEPDDSASSPQGTYSSGVAESSSGTTLDNASRTGAWASGYGSSGSANK